MKIETVPIQSLISEDRGGATVVMFKMVGAFDGQDQVVQIARQMVIKAGTPDMVQAFEKSISNGSLKNLLEAKIAEN